MVHDIFARLPAKSVLRCRCLSRAWAAALSSDAFVDKHFHLSNLLDAIPKLCLLPPSAASSTVYAWSPPEEQGEKGGGFTPLMNVPHNARNGRLCAVTRPCHGLLLLRVLNARRYFLCNPSIGQITALPDGPMAGPPLPCKDYASFGLGYDARTRAHKVVRLLYHDRRPAGCDIYDVNSTTTGGHWRPAASGAAPPERVRMNQMGVCAHGHVHWLTMRYNGDEEAIVSFSVSDEVFGYVAPPPPGATVAGFSLTELDGRLCLFSAPHDPVSPLKRNDIWLVTEYAARATWGKHWHIDLATLPPRAQDFMFECVSPVALVDGGTRVVFLSLEGRVAAFCLATGTLLEVEEDIVPPSLDKGLHHMGSNALHLAPYQESLVSPGRPFEDALFSRPLALALSVALPPVFVHPFGSTPLLPEEIVDPMEQRTVVSLEESCSGAAAGHGKKLLLPPLSIGRVVCRNPCHGLVLLSHQHGKCHVLCNPVTQGRRGFYMPGQGHGCAGLGYDHSREEHVIVRLSYTSPRFDTITREHAMAECTMWPLRDLRPRTLSCQPPVPVVVDAPPVHVAGKMYWPGEPRFVGIATAVVAFDISSEAFELVPAPPVFLDVTGGDRMVLAELAGKLCAACFTATTETMTVWGQDGEGLWTREHMIELGQWPEFSPRTTGLTVIPIAVDPEDGRILLHTGKALGYYDTRSRTLETVFSLKSLLDDRQVVADDLFVIASISEDSLFCPYDDRKCRLW
ncbi:hypothetical protein QOZ80_5BG0446890 [Eleusine coracana subsp. coracana]|nr:hypothetical protein QOZ80_5BG0446890 [Eleusine coracana subsp. coracana]